MFLPNNLLITRTRLVVIGYSLHTTNLVCVILVKLWVNILWGLLVYVLNLILSGHII